MHIETSADARWSTRRHTVSGGHDGPAAGGRGYLVTAASRFSSWWSGERRPPALTADADSGAGLQGGLTDYDPPSNGGAATAPSEGGDQALKSNLPCRATWRASARAPSVRAQIAQHGCWHGQTTTNIGAFKTIAELVRV